MTGPCPKSNFFDSWHLVCTTWWPKKITNAKKNCHWAHLESLSSLAHKHDNKKIGLMIFLATCLLSGLFWIEVYWVREFEASFEKIWIKDPNLVLASVVCPLGSVKSTLLPSLLQISVCSENLTFQLVVWASYYLQNQFMPL